MTITPKPKREEFKTRKEYRFAIKKHKREIQKQPIIWVTAIVMALVITISHSGGATVVSGIITAIVVYNMQKEYKSDLN
jgi:hypothetical protein